MKYELLYDNPDKSLLDRLMHIRNIDDNIESFLSPDYKTYWNDPRSLQDMDTAVDRILHAIKKQEKIMIFGDYDVDGIMSSYVMYIFFTKFLHYKNISIRLPHRTKDGYGIKSYHLDEIKELGCSLVITVDNGITSVQEAKHAQDIGIDLIITDHHKPLEKIPQALALVNPHCSPDYAFPEICGATVAWKLCHALADKLITDRVVRKTMHDRLLPFVSIATVADCMPLVHENRLLVKKGLELMNQKRHQMAPTLRNFIEYLNIKQIDTYHIGFMISPRLNATGRIGDAMDGLASLLINNPQKQLLQIQKMDELNTQRRKTQEEMIKIAQELINPDRFLLHAAHETFHSGIVGIVAGRITEKYYKPSLIMGVDKKKGIATGSLRGPDYFNIVDMLTTADDLLLRYGGHAQAGGMTVTLENLDACLARFHDYCSSHIQGDKLEKTTYVDTKLYSHELSKDLMGQVSQFGPYGEGNKEPMFLLEDTVIQHAETIGKGERTHLKLKAKKDDRAFSIMQRGKGENIGDIQKNTPLSILGRVKKDTFNGGFYVEGKWMGEEDASTP